MGYKLTIDKHRTVLQVITCCSAHYCDCRWLCYDWANSWRWQSESRNLTYTIQATSAVYSAAGFMVGHLILVFYFACEHILFVLASVNSCWIWFLDWILYVLMTRNRICLSLANNCVQHNLVDNLPRWLSWLRHSAHQPGRSVGGAGVQFPGSAGRFRVRISGVHALRLIYRAGKEGSTVSSIICDRWLILS